MMETSILKFEHSLTMKARNELLALSDEEDMKKNKNFGKHLIYPTYTKDGRLGIFREVNKPPESLFLALGFNPTYESK